MVRRYRRAGGPQRMEDEPGGLKPIGLIHVGTVPTTHKDKRTVRKWKLLTKNRERLHEAEAEAHAARMASRGR